MYQNGNQINWIYCNNFDLISHFKFKDLTNKLLKWTIKKRIFILKIVLLNWKIHFILNYVNMHRVPYSRRYPIFHPENTRCLREYGREGFLYQQNPICVVQSVQILFNWMEIPCVCVYFFSHDINITYTYVELATNLNTMCGIPAFVYYSVNECYILNWLESRRMYFFLFSLVYKLNVKNDII